MDGRFRKLTRLRWVLPTVAILLVVFTAAVLTLSLGTIRTRSFFERTIRRLETLDRRGEYDDSFTNELREASRFARSGGDWRRILQLSWKQPEPERWYTLYELSTAASSAMPEEARWRIIGAYAAVQRDLPAEALRLLQAIAPAGETVQYLRILAAVDQSAGMDPADSRADSLRALIGTDPGDITAAALSALLHPRAETLSKAWEETGIRVFAVNGALHAAAEGNRDQTRLLADQLRSSEYGGRPLIYLAAWLRETDWLFRLLRQLPPRESVVPDLLLLQADGHLRHSQWDEARWIYRELQDTDPDISSLIFLNDAVLTTRLGDGAALEILDRGDRYHRDDRLLQLALAGALARNNQQDEARRRLELLQALYAGDHEIWLLRRLLQARSDALRNAPPQRIESDLWAYLNSNPDAHKVAALLARQQLIRGDTSGLVELRRRYPPGAAPWATVVHVIDAIERDRLDIAESYLHLLSTDDRDSFDWTQYYNRALFALRFLPPPDIGRQITAFRTWWERDALLTEEQRRSTGTELLLLEAEQARLLGDLAGALLLVERAIDLTPDRESLYSYRTRIARQD